MSLYRILIFLWLPVALFGQFGQNKVQYKDFKWRYIQTKHFDVYFYLGGETTAEFAAEILEPFYTRLEKNWNYKLKKRIAIFLYNSHNDFKQSLIVDSYLSEGIGGVTELFKNRIIVPFEGDYMKFDHVLKHELVHGIMNDLLYDGSIQALISRRVTQPPLWFTEGLAEWEASQWNPELDMAVRDMVINSTIPPISFLQYVSPYQGGANVMKYISKRFGREKIGELLHKLRTSLSFYDSFESTIGLDSEKFTEEWHRFLQKQYWPEVQNRKYASELFERLTDHRKDGSYINTAPAISPKGDRIAYLSNKGNGYMSIYLMDSFNGREIQRVVKGNTSDKFDDMHWLNSGMSFSPDANKLAFASFAGEKDLLNIADLESGDIESMSFDVDGLYEPAFSPDGKRIAFVGIKWGASDIYIYDFETKKLSNLTNDVFSDLNPTWSPDGKTIAFTSDRASNTQTGVQPYEIKMHKYDYRHKDIYTIDVSTQMVRRITNSNATSQSPAWAPDGKHLAFVSDRSGISNIYVKNIDTNEPEYAVTDLLTGAYHLDWSKDGSQLVFVSFDNRGYDIYSIVNPLGLKKTDPQPTAFLKNKDADYFKVVNTTLRPDSSMVRFGDIISQNDYSSFDFTRIRNRSDKSTQKVPRNKRFLSDEDIKVDNKYKVRDYNDDEWSLDFITGSANFNTYYGFSGYYQFSLSEKAGKQRLNLYSNLVFNFRNADVILSYEYLPNQINYMASVYHLSNSFTDGFGTIFTFRYYGAMGAMTYPLSRFQRLETGLQLIKYELSTGNIARSGNFNQYSTNLDASLGYVFDNTKYYVSGPIDGTRFYVKGEYAPSVEENSPNYLNLKVDFRNYFELATGTSLAFRFSGGTSYGLQSRDGQMFGQKVFRLGGVSNWFINQRFKDENSGNTNNNIFVNDVEDLSFTEFITPLRGAIYNEQSGRHYALMNTELRFPLIDYFVTQGVALPFLSGIRGALFTDIGTAFTNLGPWRAFKDNGDTQSLIIGYGYGAQMYVPFIGAILRIDRAWRWGSQYPDDITYVSFGLDF